MSLVKCWCFTLNNFTEEEKNKLINSEFGYLIFGYEKGDKGTPHLQGYIEFKCKKRLTTIKKINDRIHWESRKGSQEQAIEYCKKENNWEEFGKKLEQGHRTDLDSARQMAVEGGMREVSAKCTYMQIKTAEKYLTYNEIARDWKPEVIWLYGEPGAGKSKHARELVNEDIFIKSEGSKWWDGYDAHECVIIDDFRDSWWSLTDMLRLLDRYECKVEVKGGMRQFLAKKIIITTVNHPKTLYSGTGENMKQLLRRIDNIGHVVPDVPEVAGNTKPQQLEQFSWEEFGYTSLVRSSLGSRLLDSSPKGERRISSSSHHAVHEQRPVGSNNTNCLCIEIDNEH